MVDPIGPLFLGPEGCYLGLCDFVWCLLSPGACSAAHRSNSRTINW